jgi:MoxR-like ATPase
VDVVATTRTLPTVALGASTRGAQHLLYACQAWAALHGRSHVTPDDVKRLASPILAHRIIVRPEQRVRGVTAESCVQDALTRVAVPVL